MTQNQIPQCGDWFKLVESLALQRQDEDGGQVRQGDYFRFLGFSAAEGFCECYAPTLKSRFWIKLDYLFPLPKCAFISQLEAEVPEAFKHSSRKNCIPRNFNNGLESVLNP